MLHGNKVASLVLTDLKDCHHVLMGECGLNARLAQKTLNKLCIAGKMRVHDLERHRAIEPRVSGAVDRRHASARDSVVDPVPGVDNTPDHRIGLVGVHNIRVYGRTGSVLSI